MTSENVDVDDPAHTWHELSLEELEAAEQVDVREAGTNMLLIEIDGTVFPVQNTYKNKLLFDRDQYSVNGRSLYTVLHSAEGKRVVLSADPYVAMGPTQHEDSYRLWFDNPDSFMVKTPVEKVQDVLEGIIELVERNNPEPLREVYNYVIDNQVRRKLVNKLVSTELPVDIRFEPDRVTILPEGWLIDGMFLLTWEAQVYLYTEHWREGSYHPRTSEQYEEPGQFMEITPDDPSVTDPREIPVGDRTVRFGELEMLFIYRATWLMDWEHNLDDQAQAKVIKRTFDKYKDIF